MQSYRELRIWQVGMEIAVSCYTLTRTFPKEELFGLTSQIRRASSSIPANIAEGYGRQNKGEYLQFLRVAKGSLRELETHLLLCTRIGLATESATNPLLALCEEEGRMLFSLMQRVSENYVRETAETYETE